MEKNYGILQPFTDISGIYLRQGNHEVKFSFSFLFKCKAGADKKTVFELEICKVPYMDNVVGKYSGFVFYRVWDM